MDPVGEIFREFLQQARINVVRNAAALGEELRKDGMDKSQVSEMLFANGFEADIVKEAIKQLFPEVN